MQGKEKGDENSGLLFKEPFDAALHDAAAKADSSIQSVVPVKKG